MEFRIYPNVTEGMALLLHESTMNPWTDCVIQVSLRHAEVAQELLETADEEWWNGLDADWCYHEYLRHALDTQNIPHYLYVTTHTNEEDE